MSLGKKESRNGVGQHHNNSVESYLQVSSLLFPVSFSCKKESINTSFPYRLTLHENPWKQMILPISEKTRFLHPGPVRPMCPCSWNLKSVACCWLSHTAVSVTEVKFGLKSVSPLIQVHKYTFSYNWDLQTPLKKTGFYDVMLSFRA